MTDWADGIEIRNYGIRRRTDRRHLAELLKITSLLGLLAAVFGFYAWIRCTIVDLGYEEQDLRVEEEALLREEKQLAIAEQSLKDPERIERIAQDQLGMNRMKTNQLITPGSQEMESGVPITLAMTAVLPGAPEPRKPSATN
jgi:cell division protein FtsL